MHLVIFGMMWSILKKNVKGFATSYLVNGKIVYPVFLIFNLKAEYHLNPYAAGG